MCLAQAAVRRYLVVVDLEVAALNLQRYLELLSAVVGYPCEEVTLLICVVLNLTAHHLIDRIRN